MGVRVAEFDILRESYDGATVTVLVGDTLALANIFSDESLTVALSNPQILTTDVIDGVSFGKWQQAVYVGTSYSLDITSKHQTGVERVPLYDLVNVDAGRALVTATNGNQARTLANRAADLIWAADFGLFDSTAAATNTTTINAAIGAAANKGGGFVLLPAGTYSYNPMSLPGGVVLVGAGRGVTVLQCQAQADTLTLTGNQAGLMNLTVDGINLQANSVGVKMTNLSQIQISDVEIKRFDNGMFCRGGRYGSWQDLFVSSCNTGAKLRGDSASAGGEYRNNHWDGGGVMLCVNRGIDIGFVDLLCRHNVFSGIEFGNNLGIAVYGNGPRFTEFRACDWHDNVGDIQLLDDVSAVANGLVIGFECLRGRMSGGTINLAGTLQDVFFTDMELAGVAWTLTSPGNAVLLRNCIEDSAVTVAGDGTKLIRQFDEYTGATTGLTTGNVATKAWSVALRPGEMAVLYGRVTGNQRNGIQRAGYDLRSVVHRAPSTLAYDTQTVNYTVGQVATGGTSGAKGLIVADADAGLTGTLSLRNISGVFVDNEVVTDALGGSALANGALVVGACVVDGTNVTLVFEDDGTWDASFVANGPEIELRVTGAAAKTIDWTVHVSMVRNG